MRRGKNRKGGGEKINYSNNQLEKAKCYIVLLILIHIQVLQQLPDDQFLLLASLVRVLVALVVKLNCRLVSGLTVIVTTMMVQSAQYVDVTNLKD